MTEVKYILNTMTDRSLIIIDELCRSTSVEEGTAIAMAICEDLALSGAYTYVTTHYTLLTKLANLFFNIKVWQMQTISAGDPSNPKSIKLDYKFSLIPGATTFRGYGIYMVRNIWPAEVMEIVDEIQAQLTQTADDPRFPTLNRRARLRYDLECKMKKLKLQKKLTVANVNQYINEYNEQLENIDETLSPHMYFQELNSTVENDAEMDHSIFDAPENPNCGYLEGEISKIYLDDLEEAKDDSFSRSNVQSEQSRSYFIQNELSDKEIVVLSPVSIHSSLQSSIISPSKAKKRMQEIFTPDTQLDMSQSSSIYHSMYASEDYGILAPKVSLNYSDSQCSLNLTQNALKLEEDPRATIEKDQKIFDFQRDAPVQISQRLPVNEWSRNVFTGFQNTEEHTASCNVTKQNPSLSQQVEKIRMQKHDFSSSYEASLPVHNDTLKPATRITDIESPFTNTFARPLQIDSTRTSTPLITKIKHNARDFGSSGTSTFLKSKEDQKKTPTTTSKISFTILNNVEGVDMQSVQEDLESFVEEMQNQDFSPEEHISNNRKYKANHLFPIVKVIEGPANPSFDEEENNPVEDFSPEDHISNNRKYKANHLFPIVKVIEGPADPSFDEEENNPVEDAHTIVKPIVRNPQPNKAKPNSNPLVEVFTRVLDRTTDIPIVNTDTPTKIMNINESNQSNNIKTEISEHQIESSPKALLYIQNKENDGIANSKNLSKQNFNREENIVRIQKFNDFTSPRNTTQSQVNSKEKYKNLLPPNAKGTDETHDKANNDRVQITKKIIKDNESQNYQNAADSTDVYESARSSPDISYSPLTPSRADFCKDFTTSSKNVLQNVYHAAEDLELDDNNDDGNSDRIQEIIELSDELEELHLSRHDTKIAVNESSEIHVCEKDEPEITRTTNEKSINFSHFYEPVLNSNNQEVNKSFITDYDKTTEEFLTTRHINIGKETIETVNSIQTDSTGNINDKTKNKSFITDYDKTTEEFLTTRHINIDKETIETVDSIQKDSTENINDKTKNNDILITELAYSSRDNVKVLVDKNAPTKNTDARSAAVKQVPSEQEISNDSVIFASESPELWDKDTEIIDQTLDVDGCEKILQEETEENKENSNPKDKNENNNILESRNTSNSEKFHKENTWLSKESDRLKAKKRLFRRRTLGLARSRKGPNENAKEKLTKESKKQNIREDNNNKIEEIVTLISDDEESDQVSAREINSQRLKKRKRPQQTGSMSTVTHSTQIKHADERNITSISEASKIRNLDEDMSRSKTEATEVKCHSTRNHMSTEDAQDKSITSVSEASRKRNLDQITTSSAFNEETSRENTDKRTKTKTNSSTTDAASAKDKSITSISEASRKRNLDQVTTSSTFVEENIDEKTDLKSPKSDLFNNTSDSQRKNPKKYLGYQRKKCKEPKDIREVNILKNVSTTDSTSAKDKSITSDSEASRKRNLDQVTTNSTFIEEKSRENADERTDLETPSSDHYNKTSDFQRKLEKNIGYRRKKKEETKDTREANILTNSFTTDSTSAKDKSITSVSEASRKRNLDQVTTSSTCIDEKSRGNTDEKTDLESPSSDHCNNTSDTPRKKPKKYTGYQRRNSAELKDTREANILTNSSTTGSASAKDTTKQKFLSPSKLTQKAIREAFFEADKKFYESSGSSAELAKLYEQKLKRPSIKQIKQSTCLATIRRTQEGVEVIPVNDQKRRKNSKVKNKILLSRTSSINMNIFSDKNADTFEEFIKSDKKDYKSFNFNFGYGEASSERNDGKMFNFKQVNAIPSEYTQSGFSLTFVRKRSEELNLASQQSSSNLPFLTQNADFTLTPDGFYKQNRDDINHLINKYK